jgi:hypothetical protein
MKLDFTKGKGWTMTLSRSSQDSISISFTLLSPDGGLSRAGTRLESLSSCSTLSPAVCDTLTQLLTPITMQIFSTPLHLYGLEIYNRQEKGIPLRNRSPAHRTPNSGTPLGSNWLALPALHLQAGLQEGRREQLDLWLEGTCGMQRLEH